MSERRERIHMDHELSKTRRCELLDVARSSAYYHPAPFSAQELALMRVIDEIHLRWPFYGSRRIRNELEDRGHAVTRSTASACSG
jgi:putative transposase